MTRASLTKIGAAALVLATAPAGRAQAPAYDMILKGGHVIDGRNGVSAIRDVAIKDGKIAAVADNLQPSSAARVVDAAGLYVTPGLVDLHVHVFAGDRGETYAGGSLSVPPDGFTLRSCVTTAADAGSSGWRSFEDFKKRI